jgi:hypothetical protein
MILMMSCDLVSSELSGRRDDLETPRSRKQLIGQSQPLNEYRQVLDQSVSMFWKSGLQVHLFSEFRYGPRRICFPG